MSNFSDFFSSSSGNGGAVASAADLPRNNTRSDTLYIKTGITTSVQSEQTEFWTYYARQYAVSDVPYDITNYTTLVNVSSSNGGVLYHVIAPSDYYHIHNHHIYIKITIDGEVTEIGPMNNSSPQYRAYHPVLGALLPFPPSTSTGHGKGLFSNTYRHFENNSDYKQSKGFWTAQSSPGFTIPTPSEADLLPKVKFNSTLTVEVKGRTTSTYNGNKAGCAYKLY
jgi:hypothetical protein